MESYVADQPPELQPQHHQQSQQEAYLAGFQAFHYYHPPAYYTVGSTGFVANGAFHAAAAAPNSCASQEGYFAGPYYYGPSTAGFDPQYIAPAPTSVYGVDCKAPTQPGTSFSFPGAQTGKNAKKPPKPMVMPLHCDVCKIECNRAEVLQSHRSGKKHKKNVKRLQDAITPKKPARPDTLSAAPLQAMPTRPGTPPSALPSVESDMANNEKAPTSIYGVDCKAPIQSGTSFPFPGAQTGKNAKKPPKPMVMPLRCDVCKIECNSAEVLQSHRYGKKHKKNMQRLQDAITPKLARPATLPAAPQQAMPARPGTPPSALPSVESDMADNEPVKVGSGKSNKKRPPAALTAEELEAKKKRIIEAGAGAELLQVCNICNVVTSCELAFRLHMTGHRHVTNVRKLQAASAT